uniref:DNA topoisomerase (ATP-hydrolyzing) n=1 Tax=viral metagenome TaxID=1070528 RepID=A0A6C0BVR7_9ZZZZ
MTTITDDLANQYQMMSDREHVLKKPDTYIGSTETDEEINWIIDDVTDPDHPKMVHRAYKKTPAIYKCFDEGIVNARDHEVRMQTNIAKSENASLVSGASDTPKMHAVKNIEVEIDRASGLIAITNDGNGIDVEKHPQHGIWIPEMIFGHLRTSTNYNDSDIKTVGGRNGFGFKLVLIFSTYGKIETVDHVRGLKYTQEFKDNLSTICPPTIVKQKGKPYTKVTFLLDYKRFGVDGLTDDMFSLLKKRTYDIAAVTDKTVKVKFNSLPVPIRSFENYVNMFIKDDDAKVIFEAPSDRWEYAVTLTPLGEFTQVSFVNGIYTSKGGKHVEYILNQIVKKVCDFIEKKKKIKVKPATIKEQLMLFVNCTVENPAFDSQTKECLTTTTAKFGSSCAVSDKFIDKVIKLGVMDQAISLNDIKHTADAAKTDGKKTRRVRGIPKLTDANEAGGPRSAECTLILCEGDSAKSGVISGLSQSARDFYGVYPLKGKLMNVRDASITAINGNDEITDIKKILGLQNGKKYTQDEIKNELRYGRVLFMTDQDLDGSHIKGLGINLFQFLWRELAVCDNFLGFMNTPILKAFKGKNDVVCFYNEQQYEEWKQTTSDSASWKVQYYKGLGTSSAKEFKEYFKQNKTVTFKHSGEDCDSAIDKAFNKKKADDRKDWLGNYDKTATLDTSSPEIRYDAFVDRELIHFSKYDCERSIASVVDGLKTSLRKIMFCAFKRRLEKDKVKVAQFAGYVSEHSLYHHGEASLNKAIVGLAQNFVGSNNINLLVPLGQFGTRLQGGKDSASERYIFTQLSTISRAIFPEVDQSTLNYLNDDGVQVEPEFYVPIIPMILVNGSRGIGTGYSSHVPCYDPRNIIDYIRCRLTENPVLPELHPHYDGFKGSVTHLGNGKYLYKGLYTLEGQDTVKIVELPVGTWTQDYKDMLEAMLAPPPKEKDDKEKKKTETYLKDYKENNTDTMVEFTLIFQRGKLMELINTPVAKLPGCNEFERLFKLYDTESTSNMHLFNEKQQIKKYETPQLIIDDFMGVRMENYTKRKENLIKELEREHTRYSNQARYIKETCDDVIDIRKKKQDDVSELLTSRGYAQIDGDERYKYLIDMPMSSLIEENIEKLNKKARDAVVELERVKNTSEREMWLSELDVLDSELTKFYQARLLETHDDGDEKPKKKTAIRKKKVEAETDQPIKMKVKKPKTKKVNGDE